VVATQHEGDEARPPPGCDLLARRVELLARRDVRRQLAVADVGQGEVLEVALDPGRVGLDGVGGETKVEWSGVGALAEVDRALERDAVDDDPVASRRKLPPRPS
jgi:hypothetical protein